MRQGIFVLHDRCNLFTIINVNQLNVRHSTTSFYLLLFIDGSELVKWNADMMG